MALHRSPIAHKNCLILPISRVGQGFRLISSGAEVNALRKRCEMLKIDHKMGLQAGNVLLVGKCKVEMRLFVINNLESGIKNLKSGAKNLGSGINNLGSMTNNPVAVVNNLESQPNNLVAGLNNPESQPENLGSRIINPVPQPNNLVGGAENLGRGSQNLTGLKASHV